MGIASALRRCEFTKLLTSDCLEGDDLLLVSIKETKNKIPRSFTIIGELYRICKKYMNIRPAVCSTYRFFLKYDKGKCINQPIGINTFGVMPKQIASFLMLPEADTFTGHTFRRTSATLLVDAGADITALKRHGGWKSNTVAEGYIANSLNNKKKIFNQITDGMSLNKITDSANTNTNVTVPGNDVALNLPTSSTHNEVQITYRSNPVNSKSITQEKPFTSRTHNCNIPVVEESQSTSQTKIENMNVLIDGDSILNTKNSSINEEDSRFPVFYDPDIGLYVYDMIKGNTNKTIVLNNCNVTLHGDLNDKFLFNNCNIRKF